MDLYISKTKRYVAFDIFTLRLDLHLFDADYYFGKMSTNISYQFSLLVYQIRAVALMIGPIIISKYVTKRTYIFIEFFKE